MEQGTNTRSIVVMGVSGAGKSTIGTALSTMLACAFLDADALHSPENVAKMSSGLALSDEDRWPWLKLVGEHIAEQARNHHDVVAACSALKRSYRDTLRNLAPNLIFVFLDGPQVVLEARLKARTNGFMPPKLLESQFRILEPLKADEAGLRIDAEKSPDEIVNLVLRYLEATP